MDERKKAIASPMFPKPSSVLGRATVDFGLKGANARFRRYHCWVSFGSVGASACVCKGVRALRRSVGFFLGCGSWSGLFMAFERRREEGGGREGGG